MKSKTLRPKIESKLNSSELDLQLTPTKTKRDHFMYNIYHKKVCIGIFQLSFGSHEFGKSLIGKMARQLGISSHDLIGIESCTFWGKDFIEKSSLIQ